MCTCVFGEAIGTGWLLDFFNHQREANDLEMATPLRNLRTFQKGFTMMYQKWIS